MFVRGVCVRVCGRREGMVEEGWHSLTQKSGGATVGRAGGVVTFAVAVVGTPAASRSRRGVIRQMPHQQYLENEHETGRC
jgi:hypothetical protein